jgi:hypothetical protein
MAEENTVVEVAKIIADIVKGAPAAIVAKILPVEKLIDTVARGIGLLYHPRHVKQASTAAAEAIVAETKAAELSKDIRQRAKFRREVEALHHQANLENIAGKAEKYLPEEVSPIPVDQGWTSAFANEAKTASRDDLQELWARILAEEVSAPGSISTRTLSLLKKVSASDAARFQRVASICVESLVPGVRDQGIVEIGLSTNDLKELADRGLIHSALDMTVNFAPGTQLQYFRQIWQLQNSTGGPVPVPLLMLTDCGIDLLRVTERHAVPNFAAIVESTIKARNANCSLAVRAK